MSSSKSKPTPEMPLVFPQSLSRYQPIAQIARGGMAEVILAEMSVGRGVTKLAVLKRIWAELAADREFVAMFLQEARLGASMNHPNIVQTFEVLGDGPRPVISMEYLDGQPLTRVLNRLVGTNTLSWTLRLRVLANVLAALDYAHELTNRQGAPEGIVHRDVNPQNVFVTYSGRVKLVDFGVAKSLTGPYQTRPGSVKGKLAYMAPEQLLGRPVDRRADLFAVGVMLWEMAAGRRLWLGMTEASIIRHLSARVPIRPIPVTTNLPHGLTKICARAVALEPEGRYATAAEFAADLERLIPGSDDSHGRHLGKVVSLAFAEEHAAREALIDRHRRRVRATGSERIQSDSNATQPESELSTIRPPRATPGGMWSPEGPHVAPLQDMRGGGSDGYGVGQIAANYAGVGNVMGSTSNISNQMSDESHRDSGVMMGVPVEPSGSLTMRIPGDRDERSRRGAHTTRLLWGAGGFAAALVLALGVVGTLALARSWTTPALPSVAERKTKAALAPAVAASAKSPLQVPSTQATRFAPLPVRAPQAATRSAEVEAAEQAANQIVIAPMALGQVGRGDGLRAASSGASATRASAVAGDLGGGATGSEEVRPGRAHPRVREREELERMWRWLRARRYSREVAAGGPATDEVVPGTGDDVLEPSFDLALAEDAKDATTGSARRSTASSRGHRGRATAAAPPAPAVPIADDDQESRR